MRADEFIAVSSDFEISLSRHGRRAGRKILGVKQCPWNPVLSRFRFASIVPSETIIEILTETLRTCDLSPRRPLYASR
jgi:hypothetical protein